MAKDNVIHLPASFLMRLERGRVNFVDQISDVRLALEVFGGEASPEARVAALNIIDKELMRIQEQLESDLECLPGSLGLEPN
ncbi:hypothetical protein MJO52_11875 [Microbulbifer variabilis]|uniref:Transcriptional regulator n=1 Tax=Microbulbifer variabilis TaxID=266805 RepID=A0ABY4V680_9GAMM|nr:hypothetical protein [Microbulbifer variabilis]USD19781.1 hypothetical protein MJO52_11875 [Microbulbifer variabilis]